MEFGMMHFLTEKWELSTQISGNYNYHLVALSLLVAVFASYTALKISERIFLRKNSKSKIVWLILGSIVMGCGVFSMHFIGMISFQLPIPVNYDLSRTLLSILPAIFGCWFVLCYLSQSKRGFLRLNIAGFFMGLGIALMHYTGMMAMQMNAYMVYDKEMFILSFIIAHVLATFSLYVASTIKKNISRYTQKLILIPSILMGIAVAGMHYVGMIASHYFPKETQIKIEGIDTPLMITILIIVNLIILSISIISTIVDRNMHEMSLTMKSLDQKVIERTSELKIINDRLIKSNIVIQEQSKIVALKSKYKEEFLANMSHEIRTPMNAIIGFSEQLVNSIKEPKQLSKINLIYSCAKSLLRIINDILDLSKIEAGKIEIIPSPMDLERLFVELKNIFQEKANKKNITIDIVFKKKPSNLLLLDEVRIRQILLNLISNAIKFTEKGNVTIFLNVKKTTKNKALITIKVKDTGVGIPKDQLVSIFDPFVQQKGQKEIKYGGTGLGLSISIKLIHKMGGDIQVKSTVNKGSTFTVKLPKVEVSDRTLETKEILFDTKSIVFEKSKLLIVDDIEANRKLIIDLLENSPKLEFIEATNGNEAIQLISQHKPNLILIDLSMPKMNGYEANKIIKKDKNTIVIAVTASYKSLEEQNKLNTLFDDVIVKPINTQMFFSTLTKYLTHKITDSKKELSSSLNYIFTEEEKPHLPKLKSVLEKDFLPNFEKLYKDLVINDIDLFGKNLLKISKELNLKTL